MSVAFRREEDEEHKEPRFELPLPAGPNLVTERGLRQIEERAAALEEQLAGELPEEERKKVLRDARYWRQRLASAQLAPTPTGDAVAVGTQVTFEREGQRRTILVVGHDESDPATDRVSFLAPLVCGYFGETGNPHDFRWGFLIAAIVTVLTVVLFETQKNKYLIGPDGKPLGIIPDARKERPQADNPARKSAHANGRPMRNYLLLALLAIALAGFFYWCFGSDWISIGIFTACIVFPVSILLEGSLTKTERDRIFVIYIIAFFVIFFWAAYEQAGASLTLFASEQTDRVILGWEMPASWIQSFNPFFVVILAAIMPGVFTSSR